jgi:FkbM family methyltransferase
MINKVRYLKYYAKVLLNNWTKNKSSYAQHGEDKLVELLLPDGVSSFIDIGANDGVLFSNTYLFAKKGAKGVCIEPSLKTFRKMRLNHLCNSKVKCVYAAVSDFNGNIYIKEKGYESTLSTVSKFNSKGSKKVPCKTFDNILKEFPIFNTVDLLSIDVEGHEEEVLRGLNSNKFSAKIVVIESDKSEIEKLLSLVALKDYLPICTNSINIILVHKEAVFNRPEKIIDGFKYIKL